jgi:DNA-binding beta-propeller fold protein YncE
MTGLHYSAQTGRLYAANGGGEILVINPRNNRIEQRWKPLGDKPALLLNIAEDSETGRLFVTDNSKAKTTLVLDIHSGKVIKQLDVATRWRCCSTRNAMKFISPSVNPARLSASMALPMR